MWSLGCRFSAMETKEWRIVVPGVQGRGGRVEVRDASEEVTSGIDLKGCLGHQQGENSSRDQARLQGRLNT